MTNNESKFDLSTFKLASSEMIAKSDNAYQTNPWDLWRDALVKTRSYTPEEVLRIVQSGSLREQQKLSRNYFYKDGYYKQIILHYATLLTYAGLLIPNPSMGKSLSTSHIQKRYYNALDYVENISLSNFAVNCTLRALIDGAYYGAIVKIDKTTFSMIDLPIKYCTSRFKDEHGNDIVEFNVQYFDSISNEEVRKSALNGYPKEISDAYKKYHKKKSKNECWVALPTNVGICFPFYEAYPFFLSVLPKSLEYDEAVETERERDMEEIRKILVQKIPHLQDGRLLFEPVEAQEIHSAAVGMLKKNKNVHVLTTYADVESISSKTSAENANNIMNRMEQNIYAQGGVSKEIFASDSPTSVKYSLENDLALMMPFVNKIGTFVTTILNDRFANSNISFKYVFLPISRYNTKDYIDSTFKLVGSGYSFLLPALATGLSQRDFVNVKDLENDVLKLTEKLKPLQTAYTQSNSVQESGRPAKDDEAKAETTIETEESRTDTEGGEL